MQKEYIYKVECFKSISNDYITAGTHSEAESKSGKLFDSYGLETMEGDFARWKIAECEDCDQFATKIADDGYVYCDDCYDLIYGEEQTNG